MPRAALMERTVSLRRRIPREVPLTSSITPLRARACKCSSAALADLNPSSAAISARVGGAPVRAMAVWMRSRICCWRAVSLGLSSMVVSGGGGYSGEQLFFNPVTVFFTSFSECASEWAKNCGFGHRWHDCGHLCAGGRQHWLHSRAGGRSAVAGGDSGLARSSGRVADRAGSAD
ncbi:hypothetical protein D3C72_1536220 [compost metagenome]